MDELVETAEAVAAYSPRETNLRKLLAAGGINGDQFIGQLEKRSITADAFMERMENAMGAKVMEPQTAIGLRALHLQSGNAVKAFNILGQAETIKAEEKGFKAIMRKVGAGLSITGNAHDLAKHYTGFGWRSLIRNGGRAFSARKWSEERHFEYALAGVDSVLKNFQGRDAAKHLGELFDLSEKSIGGIVEAAQHVLKDPAVRQRIKDSLKEQAENTAKTKAFEAAKSAAAKAGEVFTEIAPTLKDVNPLFGVTQPEVYLALNEVLAAVGKFHNPHDTKRMADMITLATRGNDTTTLEKLTQYWQAAQTPLETVIEADAARKLEVAEAAKLGVELEAEAAPKLLPTIEKTVEKIAFKSNPLVNLGAAALTMGGAIYVGHHFAKGHEQVTQSIDPDGTKVIEKEHIPAGFWAKTARFIGVTGLLAACGVAGFRAAALPNKEGISFAEKLLAGEVFGKAALAKV